LTFKEFEKWRGARRSGWWLVAGGWWLVAGGWWLVEKIWNRGKFACGIDILDYRKNMTATLEKKPRKISVCGKVGLKKHASGSVVTKSPKKPLSKKPFAYLIGCIEGTPDLSSRKGYNSI
jgi:hypothetical protein